MEAHDKEGITEARYPLGQRGRAVAQISYHYGTKYVGLTEYRKDDQSEDMVRKTGVNTRGEGKHASGFDRGAKTHHIQQSIPCFDFGFVGSLTSLCHSNGHIETMPAR